MRLSIDCKATVNIGDYSRGGKTRGDNQAADHDMGCHESMVGNGQNHPLSPKRRFFDLGRYGLRPLFGSDGRIS